MWSYNNLGKADSLLSASPISRLSSSSQCSISSNSKANIQALCLSPSSGTSESSLLDTRTALNISSTPDSYQQACHVTTKHTDASFEKLQGSMQEWEILKQGHQLLSDDWQAVSAQQREIFARYIILPEKIRCQLRDTVLTNISDSEQCFEKLNSIRASLYSGADDLKYHMQELFEKLEVMTYSHKRQKYALIHIEADLARSSEADDDYGEDEDMIKRVAKLSVEDINKQDSTKNLTLLNKVNTFESSDDRQHSRHDWHAGRVREQRLTEPSFDTREDSIVNDIAEEKDTLNLQQSWN